MDWSRVPFPVWSLGKRSKSGVSFIQISDAKHGPCLPIFTDEDLANRYIAGKLSNQSPPPSLIKIDDMKTLGSVTRALSTIGCKSIIVDVVANATTSKANTFAVANIISECEKQIGE